MNNDWTNRPIPAPTTVAAPLAPCFVDEPFVKLEPTERLAIRMSYPLRGMRNAETGCYLRERAAKMLYEVIELLPDGLGLCIWDAWRPFALQQELFDIFRDIVIEQFGLAELPEEERLKVIAEYVALPIENRDTPPFHTTGGAIDLTLIGPDGRVLEMGTAFDEIADATSTLWYEDAAHVGDDPRAKEIQRNRRLFYHAMTTVGFVNTPYEWWHYSYGEADWACATGQPARYNGRFTRDELRFAPIG